MSTVNLKQARAKLSELVTAAERGETTIISRRGKQAAVLGPTTSNRPKRLPKLAKFRASLQNGGNALSDTVIDLRNRERY